MTNKEMIKDLKDVDEIIKIYVSNKEDKHFARSLLGCMIGKLEQHPQQGEKLQLNEEFIHEVANVICKTPNSLTGQVSDYPVEVMVEYLKSKLVKQQGQGWIPVSERLPEDGECYLVEKENGFFGIGHLAYDEGLGCRRWYNGNYETICVYAWQPIEPYRPREES